MVAVRRLHGRKAGGAVRTSPRRREGPAGDGRALLSSKTHTGGPDEDGDGPGRSSCPRSRRTPARGPDEPAGPAVREPGLASSGASRSTIATWSRLRPWPTCLAGTSTVGVNTAATVLLERGVSPWTRRFSLAIPMAASSSRVSMVIPRTTAQGPGYSALGIKRRARRRSSREQIGSRRPADRLG